MLNEIATNLTEAYLLLTIGLMSVLVFSTWLTNPT